ncbi:MAG TPA: hypothetical protein VL978_14830, partial [Puia sp.]|nr:hypothetical protein [Puia sp.]
QFKLQGGDISQFNQLGKDLKNIRLRLRYTHVELVIIDCLCIFVAVYANDFDSAIKLLRSCIYSTYKASKYDNVPVSISGEMQFLLQGIKELYLKGQIHSLKKLFSEGFIQEENTKIPYSEVFNPIYLAINSLDPKAEKVNLAPEKAGIVDEIREYILSKE